MSGRTWILVRTLVGAILFLMAMVFAFGGEYDHATFDLVLSLYMMRARWSNEERL